jgi:hypothetical protein
MTATSEQERLLIGETSVPATAGTVRDVLDPPANTGLGHRQVQRWNLPAGWVISARPAHPALVSEANFIAAQDANAPRGQAGPATRRYLLPGCCAAAPAAAAGIGLVQRQACLPLPPRSVELGNDPDRARLIYRAAHAPWGARCTGGGRLGDGDPGVAPGGLPRPSPSP